MIQSIDQTIRLVIAAFLFGLTPLSLMSCTTTPYQESTGQYLDSSVITTKVKSKLLADEYMNGLAITVTTYQNVVQLSGFVNSASQANRAVALAKGVKGVRAVKNALIIK